MHKPSEEQVLQQSNSILFKKLGRNEILPKVMRTSPPKKNRMLSPGMTKKARHVLQNRSRASKTAKTALSPCVTTKSKSLLTKKAFKNNPYTTK